MKTKNLIIMTVTQLVAVTAFAKVGFDAPKKNSQLSKSSILKGFCEGKTDVTISGPGIAKNKKISCQKQKYWEYSLVNVYKDMPDGEIKIKVAQGSVTGSRVFANNVKIEEPDVEQPKPEEPVVEPPKPTPTPVPPTPTPTPVPEVPTQPVGNLDPKKAPGQNFDLKLWKLTLAVDKDGKTAGTAIEIKPLTETYSNKEAFYTAADGAMVFRASALGATTSGSKYPRSELREMTASYSNAAWTIEQGGEMHAELAVNELPVKSDGSKGRIVIGQIHGPDDELCRLYYDNGKLYYVNDKAGSGNTETIFQMKSSAGKETAIPMNARFQYSIVVRNGIQTVSAVHDGVTYVASEKIGSFWPKKALYFKAGVYVQVGKPGSGAGTTGSGVGQVSFYKLTPPKH